MQATTDSQSKKQKVTLKPCQSVEKETSNPQVLEIKGIGLKEQRIFTQIDPDTKSFNGYTELHFNSLPGSILSGDVMLSINSKNLDILNVTNNKKDIKYEIDKINFKIIIKEKLSPVSVVSISYKGNILANMEGLYVSNYIHPDTKKEMEIFSTHFEPSYASQAFPCIDHPSVKTIFKISISAPESLTVLSNTDAISNRENINDFETSALSNEHIKKDDFKITHFDATPIMSTYLIAFAVGEFEKISKGRSEIYAPFKIADGTLALEVAEFSLNFFEHFFGVPFPLKLLKHVAIPEFSMGAMENWGLVTYRMTSLMHSQTSSIKSKQNLMLTVAHEIAHQWFGNLVTMEWWDDLWLNEGFATWCEYHAIDYLVKNQGSEPKKGLVVPQLDFKYDAWTSFILETTNPGLNLDAMNSSHAVHSHVNRVEDIEQLFDEIAYNKGSALIRMMHDYIGDAFKSNLKKYIQTYQYINANKENLFDTLDKGSDDDKINLKKIMTAWITQQGFPFLIVGDKNGKLQIRQNIFTNGLNRVHEIESVKQKYFLEYENVATARNDNLTAGAPAINTDENAENKDKNQGKLKNKEYSWPIPIKINWNGEVKNYLMTGNTIEVEKISDNYVVNDEKVGFYRVFYKTPSSQSSVDTVKICNVVSFLVDYFAFAKNGYIGIGEYLENVYFSDKFRQLLFNNYYFLSEVFVHLNHLKETFPEASSFLNKFLRNFVITPGRHNNSDLEEIINFDLDTKLEDDVMQLNALKVSIALEVSTESELELLYNKLSIKNIQPVYLSSKYLSIMKYKDDYDEILRISKEGDLGEKLAAILNLGTSLNEETYKKAMAPLLTDEIKAGDKLYLAYSLLGNKKYKHLFCKFFWENYEEAWVAYKKSSNLFSRLVERAIVGCDGSLWEGKTPFEGTEVAFKKGLERYEINSVFRKKNLEYFSQYTE
ncbi:Aminopeptidase M1-A [Cucumispora dikerogammari]|nr:Aminopeptidase M1-A [Cucumispora dikerogammari]